MQTPNGKKTAPFAGTRQTEGETGNAKGDRGPLPAKTVHERGDPEQVEAQRVNIQHRDPRLHEYHLVEKGERRRGKRSALAREQHEPAEVHRHDRKRSEHNARIAPAERPIAKRADRQRHELLGERRMHRVEQRPGRSGLQHLLRRRHVVNFVEGDLFRRGQSDHQREMRRDEYRDRNQHNIQDRDLDLDWTGRNKRRFDRGFGGTIGHARRLGTRRISR